MKILSAQLRHEYNKVRRELNMKNGTMTTRFLLLHYLSIKWKLN